MTRPSEIEPSFENPEIPQNVAVLVAWPYGNGPRHLGHGASLVPGDVLARYFRSAGSDVLMVSGTDEHGTPNMIAAEKAGEDPADYVAGTNATIRSDFEDLGMSFDWFTRTTSPEHREMAQGLFASLVDAGYIKQDTMMGAFDSETDQALPDRYVEGGCPGCGANSRGDQCDGCSKMLDPQELIDPVSRRTGNPVEFRETKHWFLQLDQLAPDVMRWLDQHEELRANAKSVSMKMAEELRPRSISRDMSWGIPLPEGYELEGDNDKVLYVWFEAVMGYVSASVEWAKEKTGDPERWKDWWTNDEAKHYYAMGKDNVPFHTIIWPAILKGIENSEADDLHMPDAIASTEYLTFNDQKLSSSKGNVVYIQDMTRLVGPDALRYYLIAGGPETRDVSFTFGELTRRVNDELIAKWGNLVGRTVNLITKNTDGKIPEVSPEQLEPADTELLADIEQAYSDVGQLIQANKFSAALRRAMDVAAHANRYIYDEEPWKTAKTDPERAKKALYMTSAAITNLATLLSPFMPHASEKVHQIFGGSGQLASQPESVPINSYEGAFALTGDYSSNKGRWHFTMPTPGTEVTKPDGHLFKKLDEEKLQEEFDAIVKNRRVGAAAITAASR